MGWRVYPDGLCEGVEARAGIDGGALRCAACAAPEGLARALHLPLFAWGLTLGRRRRSEARGLSQGPPFHNPLRFAWVAGEGAGVRGGQDKQDRGKLL